MLNFIRNAFNKKEPTVEKSYKTLKYIEDNLDTLQGQKNVLDFINECGLKLTEKSNEPYLSLIFKNDEFEVIYKLEDEIAFLSPHGKLSAKEAIYIMILYADLNNTVLPESAMRLIPFYMQYVYGQLYKEILISTSFEVWPYGIINNEIYSIIRKASKIPSLFSNHYLDRNFYEEHVLHGDTSIRKELNITSSHNLTGDAKIDKTLYIVLFILKNTTEDEFNQAYNIMVNLDIVDYTERSHHIKNYLFTQSIPELKRAFDFIYNEGNIGLNERKGAHEAQ